MSIFQSKHTYETSKGVEVVLPIGVSKVISSKRHVGFNVTIEGNTRKFHCEDYTNMDVCLKKSLEHLKSKIKEGCMPGRFHTRKHRSSTDRVDVPGVSFTSVINRTTNGFEYRAYVLCVTYPDISKDKSVAKQFYVGTDKTWENNYDIILGRAMRLRETSMKAFKREFLRRLPTV